MTSLWHFLRNLKERLNAITSRNPKFLWPSKLMLNDFQPPKSPEIFLVTDCDEPGARWDYNYKTDSRSKAGKVFDGLSSLTFARNFENGKFKFGFKYGKCLKLFRNSIRQIKGKFLKDSLEVNNQFFQFFHIF